MKTQNIIKSIFKGALIAALIAPCTMLWSCKDDNTTSGDKYLRLEDPTVNNALLVESFSELGFNVPSKIGDETSPMMTYSVRSNSKWEVVTDERDGDWLLVYPREGEGDGKVRFCVKDNDATATRSTTVIFRYANGKLTEATLTVKQGSNTPYITLKVDGVAASMVKAKRDASSFEIGAASNIDFYYSTSDSWFQIVENGNGKYTLKVDAYPADREEISREGTLTFIGMGANASTSAVLTINQSVADYASSTTVTIAELLSSLPASGFVDKNYRVTGYVVSQPENGNIGSNQLLLQDASHRGLMIELSSDADNTYAYGTQMSVWMLGKDVKNNCISDVKAAESIYGVGAGSVPNDIALELTSLNDCDNYRNTLVTIKNAEWVFPYGTYYPGDEVASYTATSVGASTDHARMLRSAGGGALRAYVMGGVAADKGANFKYARALPQGSGSLTGIITTKKDDTKDELTTIIRMRSADDDAIAASGARGWTDIVEFVFPPFDMSGVVPITPSKGAGTLKTTFETTWNFSNSNATIYAGYNYWRSDYTVASATGTTYVGLNGKGWVAHAGSTMNYPDANFKGEAWIATFSTANVSASDEARMTLATSSSATGPRFFTVEWAESEAGPFTAFAEYESTNWDALKHAPEFSFVLPAACYGKANVVVRMRVNRDQRSDLSGSSTIGGSGTNRMCAFSVAKRAK